MTLTPTPKGFDLPQKPELPDHFTSDSLTSYVDFWEQVKGICDWHIGQALVQAKEDLGHGNFMSWYKARGWNANRVADLINWYSDPDILRAAKFEIEKSTSRFARRALVKTSPTVKQAVAHHVTENNDKLTAANFQELEETAAELADDNLGLKDQIATLKAQLKKATSPDTGKDPSQGRKNMARDHERAMTLGGGAQRQDLTRYFEYRDLYTEEGRKFMDKVVKNTWQVLKANLTDTGDPIK